MKQILAHTVATGQISGLCLKCVWWSGERAVPLEFNGRLELKGMEIPLSSVERFCRSVPLPLTARRVFSLHTSINFARYAVF